MGDGTYKNVTIDLMSNQTDTDDNRCGLMTEEIANTYMTCSFWMEGVLIMGTGNNIKTILIKQRKLT